VIGTLSTIATLPLAVGLGILAGYLRGWVDELVQYLYTTLSSIPNVLLIAACVLMMQVFIDTHPNMFETGAERADVRLFMLCVILGLTGWATLCRLLRAETMKLSQLEYVQAATAFGVRSVRIMARHIFPNVVHLIIITTVLELFGADPLRSGAVVRGRGRRSVDEQLRRHDQPGPQRDEPRPAGVVVVRGRVRLHGHAGARRESVRRRCSRCLRPTGARVPSAVAQERRGMTGPTC